MTEIFETPTTPNENQEPQPATPPVASAPAPTPAVIPDSLKGLVGEGKKYATLEAALSSIGPAQEHILRLEDELRQARESVQSGDALKETYETVQEMLTKLRETPQASVVDEAAIAGLLDRKLTEREQKQIVAANAATVKQALEAKYGDKAKEVYDAKAEELGIKDGFLNDLAVKSPKAVLELFGIKPAASKATPSTPGSVNTAQFDNRPQPTQSKNIMFGAKTEDILTKWRAAKPQ